METYQEQVNSCNDFDIIIIGAGPGGLECANQLKNSKLSVLLLEKNRTIGPKICAGGLTNLDKNFDIPEAKTRSFSKQKILIADNEYIINLANPLRTISRYDLGQHQLNKIKSASNLTILNETLVTKIEPHKIITNRGEFFYKYLVGADGSGSIVRKHLKLKSEFLIGICYDLLKKTDEFLWFADFKKLPLAYIWVFPHQSFTNIGILFNPKRIKSIQAKQALIKFLKKHHYPYHENEFKGAPISNCYQGCIFDNIYLVGDAAGLTSKATGEGIAFALTSGKEIAKKILDPNHHMIELEKIIAIKKRQERMAKLLHIFPFLKVGLIKIFVQLVKYRWFQRYFGN